MKHTRQLKDAAAALTESAANLPELKRLLSDLKITRQALNQNPKILSELSEKSIKLEKRQKILRQIFQDQVRHEIINALLILQRENLLSELKEFVPLAFRAAEEKNRLYTASVISALPLAPAERDELVGLLEKKFPDRSLMFEENVDSRILGGLTVAIGDLRFDASLKGKIKQLTRQLMEMP